MRLARTEIWERNLLEDSFLPGVDEPWELTTCAHCGEKKAVATMEHRMAGVTQCRSCAQGGVPVDPWARVRIILDILPTDSYRARKCSCNKWELIDTTLGDQVVLSWCEQGPGSELEELARTYSKEWIRDPAIRRLLSRSCQIRCRSR